MVSDTTLIVIATVVQTVVLSLTLLIFIFQFRSQEKAIKDAAYQNVMSHYTDYIRMLVEEPRLSRFAFEVDSPEMAKVREMSPDDQSLTAYLLLGYGIFEEVYTLHKKKWIDEESWLQWRSFLERYSTHPLFRQIHAFSKGTFDPDFEAEVESMLAKRDADSKKKQ